MNRRLFRSPADRVVAGVAGGMAEAYELDPALVRIGWALLILFSGGLFLIIYVIMAIVVPLRPVGMTLWAAAPGGMAAPPGYGEGETQPPDQPSMSGYGAPHQKERSGIAGAIVLGLILVILGTFFLARQFIPALDFGLIWPFIAIGGGLLLIVAAFARQRPGT